MSRVSTLYELQELDLALDTARTALRGVEERLQNDEELVAAREQVQVLEKEYAELRRRQRDADQEVENVRQRLKAMEDKLYGGSVRSPRELEDLQQDVDALKRQLRVREDEELGLMVQAEEVEGQLNHARANLARVEEVWHREQAELKTQQASLQAEIATLSARRDAQAGLSDATAISLYSSLRERRQGRAVARVQQGMCQGCRISLPTTVLQKARPGIELVQCPSCERILLIS